MLSIKISFLSKLQQLTLWLFNIDMENGPFIDGLPIKNGWIFHSYVKLPQGIAYIDHYISTILRP